nr:hypothetical protein CFP56_73403 [Quercus suber]
MRAAAEDWYNDKRILRHCLLAVQWSAGDNISSGRPEPLVRDYIDPNTRKRLALVISETYQVFQELHDIVKTCRLSCCSGRRPAGPGHASQDHQGCSVPSDQSPRIARLDAVPETVLRVLRGLVVRLLPRRAPTPPAWPHTVAYKQALHGLFRLGPWYVHILRALSLVVVRTRVRSAVIERYRCHAPLRNRMCIRGVASEKIESRGRNGHGHCGLWCFGMPDDGTITLKSEPRTWLGLGRWWGPLGAGVMNRASVDMDG